MITDPRKLLSDFGDLLGLPERVELEVPIPPLPAMRSEPIIIPVKGRRPMVNMVKPKKYRDYLDELAEFFYGFPDLLDVYWIGIGVVSCTPFPKGVSKNNLAEYRPSKRVKGDVDNILKPFQDALEITEIVPNDNQFIYGFASKFRSLHGAHSIIQLYGIRNEDKETTRSYQI